MEKKMFKIVLFLTIVISCNLYSSPRACSEGVGGGDICENQIKQIRDKISDFILQGKHTELNFPEGMTPDSYADAILPMMSSAQIRCVSEGDQGYPVFIKDK